MINFTRSNEQRKVQTETPTHIDSVVVPYIKVVSDQIRRVLHKHRIRTVFKPHNTIGSIFKKPKDRAPQERIAGVVYKVKCNDCNFTYVGESKRSWASRSTEHCPGRAASKESAIAYHAERVGHDIHPNYASILERNVTNYNKRIFLESLHSTLDKNTVNERKEFPRPYLPLLKSLGGGN